MTGRWRAAASLAGYILLLVAVLVGLHLLGSGELAAPPLAGGPAALQRWLQGRPPPVAAFALIRGGISILAWYLLATALAAWALRVMGATRAATVVDALSLPPVRRLAQAVAGFSLAASTLAAASVVTAAAGPAGASTTRHAATAGATTPRAPTDDEVVMQPLPEEEVVMRRLPDDAVHPGPGEGSWAVRAGDHFWGVAEDVLRAAWGRGPRNAEIVHYWRQLVEVNRDRLVDPNNADLLVPGQVLKVPTPPPVPG